MDINQAKQTLRNLSKEGCLITSKHCREKMQERSVTMEDILNVLMWGNVNNSKKDDNYDNWKMEIEGNDLDGDKLTVQVAVNEAERAIFIITVY